MNRYGPNAINRYHIGLDERGEAIQWESILDEKHPVTKSVELDTIEGRQTLWVQARPVCIPSWSKRFRRAWDVFTGKADALYWPHQ